MLSAGWREKYLFGWQLSLLFLLLYGFFPFFISEVLEAREISWSHSIALVTLGFLVVHILHYKPSSFRVTYSKALPLNEVSSFVIFFVFISCAVVFYLYPWHSDRLSYGASIAAIFRALWLFVVFSLVDSSHKKRVTVLILTLLLMYLDQSRTYFFIALTVILSTFNNKYKIFIIVAILILVMAAIRMDKMDNLFQGFYYGLFGEIYNATIVVGQINSLPNPMESEPGHMIGVIFQPFTFLLHKLNFIPEIRDFFGFGDEVYKQIGEKISPMGGWYIGADFVHFGIAGLPFIFVYYYVIFHILRMFFANERFPFFIYFLPIMIKSNPFVFMNFIIYIWVVFFIARRIFGFRLSG